MGIYAVRKITTDNSGKETIVEQQYSYRRDPQNYFLLYVDGLSDILLNITSANEIKVFLALCSITSFNKNVVPITKAEKEKIAEMINSTTGSVGNALSQLCSMGYLTRKGGNYTISHHLFWKGNTKVRSALVDSKSKQVLQDAGNDFLKVPDQSIDNTEQLND